MATNKRRRKVNGTEVQNGGNISAGEESEVFLPFSGGKSFTSAEQLPQLDQRPSKSTLKTGRSIGVQCEASTDLLPHSIVFDVESNSEAVMHTKWSFDEANMLLVASESHPRFYEIPLEIAPNKSALSQLNTSHSILEEPAMVTALCWISATDAILAVWNESIDIVEEDVASSKVILLRSFGTEATVISSILQVVFALRWRAETRRLLGICGNDLKGAIWLWDAATGQTLHFLPMDTTILDAVWLSDSHFCICGHGLLQIYVIDVKLKLQKSYSTHVQWEQVKYDPLHRVVACLSLEQNILGICNESDSDISTINFTEGNLTGMDFQPNALTENHTANFDEKAPSILATSSDSGIIQLWDASCPFQQLHRIHMDVPIMAMDFSPNGQLLAAAGFDNINIWSNERGAIPVASWQPPANEWKSDISDNDAESVPDHALSWNADSTKLVYMLGNQVSGMVPIPTCLHTRPFHFSSYRYLNYHFWLTSIAARSQ